VLLSPAAIELGIGPVPVVAIEKIERPTEN